MISNPSPACVLIIEDEYFIASDIVHTLQQGGLRTLGPVSDPAAAVRMLESEQVDFAVVDINLEGKMSFSVAADLRRRAIPFLFYTGYEASVVPHEFGDVILLQKPNDGDALVAEIRRLVTTSSAGDPTA